MNGLSTTVNKKIEDLAKKLDIDRINQMTDELIRKLNKSETGGADLVPDMQTRVEER